jgi:N-acetylglucosaminyl-diphospho-decaprenol L-rhamnosyltransferase
LAPALSYCVVNTDGREHLLACLEAIARHHPDGTESELLVLDNASTDGSADAARRWAAARSAASPEMRLVEQRLRRGKAENDTLLLREAGGEYCLLLNEDTELRPGSVEALLAALDADPKAGAAGAQLLDPDGAPQPCAWRLPSVGTAIAGALFLHRLYTVQSGGARTRPVGWVQSSAMLVRRRAAAEVGYFDPDFFVYSDETDFCKRLHDGGWRVLYVPEARAVHHEQLATDVAAGARRVVEFHRGRDLYMRKHHPRPVAAVARVLGAWAYLLRAAAALVLPNHDPRWYLLHARQALRPGRGEGLREAAAERNRQRGIDERQEPR